MNDRKSIPISISFESPLNLSPYSVVKHRFMCNAQECKEGFAFLFVCHYHLFSEKRHSY